MASGIDSAVAHPTSLRVNTKAAAQTANEELGLPQSVLHHKLDDLSMSVVPVHQYESILTQLWKRMNFKLPVIRYGAPTREANIAHFASLGLSPELMSRAREISKGSSLFGDLVYPSTSRATRAYIGIFTTYLVFIDDMDVDQLAGLVNFRHCLHQGLPQSNLILQSFADFLLGLEEHVGKFGADMVFKSAVDFVSACQLELTQMVPPTGANLFPTYLRLKTGISEAFAYFMFPEYMYPEEKSLHQYIFAIPEIINLFNTIQDVISFYKESIVGDERFNFIYNIATSKRWRTPVTVLWTASTAPGGCCLSIPPWRGLWRTLFKVLLCGITVSTHDIGCQSCKLLPLGLPPRSWMISKLYLGKPTV